MSIKLDFIAGHIRIVFDLRGLGALPVKTGSQAPFLAVTASCNPLPVKTELRRAVCSPHKRHFWLQPSASENGASRAVCSPHELCFSCDSFLLPSASENRACEDCVQSSQALFLAVKAFCNLLPAKMEFARAVCGPCELFLVAEASQAGPSLFPGWPYGLDLSTLWATSGPQAMKGTSSSQFLLWGWEEREVFAPCDAWLMQTQTDEYPDVLTLLFSPPSGPSQSSS
ncbi:hypothetical protein L345_05964, partial [Ophiophagus hannah]